METASNRLKLVLILAGPTSRGSESLRWLEE